ncbi:hypothetical protein [Rhizobium johnstonii]|uniref:hypothetical protein n=1 Tax=Rhizobium johnstonii TaxID=3019933 RepID=UPI003F97B02D
MRILYILAVLCFAFTTNAEEIVVDSVDLPGASLTQEVTYSTTKADYNQTRDDILSRMKSGDKSAFVNNPSPWKRVETTATIGVAYKGVGASTGKKHLRQISASEEALFLFEKK